MLGLLLGAPNIVADQVVLGIYDPFTGLVNRIADSPGLLDVEQLGLVKLVHHKGLDALRELKTLLIIVITIMVVVINFVAQEVIHLVSGWIRRINGPIQTL